MHHSEQEWKALSEAGQKAAESAKAQQAATYSKQLRAVFDKADASGDGQLTSDEMLEGFKSYNYDDKQVP